MTYSILLQQHLQSAIAQGMTVSSALKSLPQLLSDLVGHAVDLVNSANNAGCCDELTVVDSEKVNTLADFLQPLREEGFVPSIPDVEVSVSIFDSHGDVYGHRTVAVVAHGLSDIIDHAAQAVLLHRSDSEMGTVLDELELALITYDVIPDEGGLPLSGCTVEVKLEVASIDIEEGPMYGGAFLDNGKRALVDRSVLQGIPVHQMSVHYPDARKYGIPDEATLDGADRLIRDLGLIPVNLDLKTKDLGDDSGGDICFIVKLPATAVFIGDIGQVEKYSAEHWDLRFQSLSASEQSEVVNRYVRTVCATR